MFLFTMCIIWRGLGYNGVHYLERLRVQWCASFGEIWSGLGFNGVHHLERLRVQWSALFGEAMSA